MDIRIKNSGEIKQAFECANRTDEDVNIIFEKGEYELTEGIEIKRDNITITGEENSVLLKGSKQISFENCTYEGDVAVIDLEKCGVTDTGAFGLGPYEDFWNFYDIPKPHMTECGPGMELYFNGERMPLSRYPESGYIRIKETKGRVKPTDPLAQRADPEGVFTASDESIKNWKNYKSTLLIGFWNYDWATQRHLIESIDSKTGWIKVNEPYHIFGYRNENVKFYFDDKGGGKFYAVNLIEGVNKPGRWYIDRENNKLYIYPYKNQNYVDVSCVDNMFFTKGHKNIKISGFEIIECRKCACFGEDCQNVEVSNLLCHDLGGWGILLEKSSKVTISDCHIYNTGGGGVGTNGGDRQSLTSAESIIKNCKIHNLAYWHKTYMAGIDISGVGITVSGNLIYDVPSFGIVYSGNNHLIEKNEICNACSESNDAGAIYTGRNWTFRGNVIRYNYLHDMTGYDNAGCVGLYFDDGASSAEVYGNIFANMPYAGIELGGGRDYKIHHNTFYNCKIAVLYDMRAKTSKLYNIDGGRLAERLAEIDYRTEVWKNAYPELYIIKENDMLMPLGNAITSNIIVGGDGICMEDKIMETITDLKDNEYIPPNAESELCKHHPGYYYIYK